jgi:hypothetical protein
MAAGCPFYLNHGNEKPFEPGLPLVSTLFDKHAQE